MKYSIIGRLNGITEGSVEAQEVIDIANGYNPIWRFVPSYNKDNRRGIQTTEESIDIMSFEIWLENIEDRDGCFDELKSLVDTHTGEVSHHECTHDELSPKPCVIAERYTNGGNE